MRVDPAWQEAMSREGRCNPLPRKTQPRDWLLVTTTDPEPGLTVAEIVSAVCEQYDLHALDLLSRRRTRAVMLPRQLTMYLAKELTLKSYPEIARAMGGRDHTTVMHAHKKVAQLLANGDNELKSNTDFLRTKLEEGVGR